MARFGTFESVAPRAPSGWKRHAWLFLVPLAFLTAMSAEYARRAVGNDPEAVTRTVEKSTPQPPLKPRAIAGKAAPRRPEIEPDPPEMPPEESEPPAAEPATAPTPKRPLSPPRQKPREEPKAKVEEPDTPEMGSLESLDSLERRRAQAMGGLKKILDSNDVSPKDVARAESAAAALMRRRSAETIKRAERLIREIREKTEKR